MWRVVVLGWAELPEIRRTALQPVLDEVAAAEGDGYVVLDERCPGLDPATVRTLLHEARDGRARVGVRPVTDTVKQVHAGAVTATVDRAGLLQVASPLVVPATYGRPVESAPSARPQGAAGQSLAAMAAALGDVVAVEVPARARRLTDAAELRLLPE